MDNISWILAKVGAGIGFVGTIFAGHFNFSDPAVMAAVSGLITVMGSFLKKKNA